MSEIKNRAFLRDRAYLRDVVATIGFLYSDSLEEYEDVFADPSDEVLDRIETMVRLRETAREQREGNE